jgi:hypothetical protein
MPTAEGGNLVACGEKAAALHFGFVKLPALLILKEGFLFPTTRTKVAPQYPGLKLK